MAQNPSSQRRGARSHFEWWERAYITDWLIVVAIYFLTLLVKGMPVFEREFDVKDPLISHKFHEDERVSDTFLHVLTFWLPLFLAGLLGALKGSTHNLHHAVLALCASTALTNLIVDFVKARVGRLRPDFLARCLWDAVLKECTGKPKRIRSGRLSFPSGHSASAFAGLGVVFLVLASQTEALRFNTLIARRSFLSSKILRLFVTILPLVLAMWIAITRLEDYRHHKEDVIAGSILGFSIALLCYTIFWPNPFSQPTGSRTVRQPKLLYKPEAQQTTLKAEDFELAPMVEENMAAADNRAGNENPSDPEANAVKDRDANGHGRVPNEGRS